MRNFLSVVALFLLASTLIACDNTNKVFRNENIVPINKQNAPVGKPTMIYVSDFDLGQAELTADPGLVDKIGSLRPRPLSTALGLNRFRKSNDPVEELHYLSDLVVDTIVKDLTDKGLPVTRIHNTTELGKSGWLISGALLKVDQGNRMERAILGFGAGESSEDLYVTLSDLAKSRDSGFQLNVTANSGKIPGAAVTLNPYAIAAKIVLDRDASEKDLVKAGHAIAEEIIHLANETK